jgi:hypothetical protein
MQKFSYYLNVLLAVGLFLIVFKYGCNPEYIEKKVVISPIVDSNAIYDHIEAEYSNKIIKLYDSIEYLNNHVKTAKTVYKTKIVQVWSDSVVTTEECSEVINQANEIILSQDTLIGVQSRGLDACQSQVNNLRSQVQLNKGYSEKLLQANILVTNENEGLKKKVKRNRGIAIIVTAILGGLVLIK